MVYPLVVSLREEGRMRMKVLDVARRLDVAQAPYVRLRDVVLPWKRNFYVLVNDSSINNVAFVRNLFVQCLIIGSGTLIPAKPFRVVAKNISAPTLTPSYHASVPSLVVNREREQMPRVHVKTFVGTLYRVELNDDRSLRRVENFFRENAVQYADVYALPGYMDDLLRISLDVYAMRGGGNGASSNDNNFRRIKRKVTRGVGSAGRSIAQTIDLAANFSMCRWFFLDESSFSDTASLTDNRTVPLIVDDYNRFRSFYSSFFSSEATLMTLWENPLGLCPRVTWDIETVARGRGTVPRGVRSDEMLSSVVILIEGGLTATGTLCRERTVVTMYLKPEYEACASKECDTATEDAIATIATGDNNAMQRLCLEYTNEKLMLRDFVLFMRTNVLVEREHMGYDEASMGWTPCITLVGYNTIGYDYQFVHDRCAFHGLWDVVESMCEASAIGRTIRDDGFRHYIAFSYVFNTRQVCTFAYFQIFFAELYFLIGTFFFYR